MLTQCSGSRGAAAKERSDPQEPHLLVLKVTLHCFVSRLITKPDCGNEHQ